MIITHCMSRSEWEIARRLETFGAESVAKCGFVHCSTIEYLWRVMPNFTGDTEPLVLLLLDTDKISAEIRWEDADNCGRAYPHVYGAIPVSAVTAVLPFLRDENGEWVKNPELAGYEDR